MKYDELTLMQFVDGELNEALMAEIETARESDKELQAYLEVYETTRGALIETAQEESIPSHIKDLIDNFSPIEKQNWLAKMVKNNPFKASIFSAVLASLVTAFQPLLVGTGGMISATQIASNTMIEVVPDINTMIQNVNTGTNTFQAASFVKSPVNKLTIGQIEKAINKLLSSNQNASKVTIMIGNSNKTIFFNKDFADNSGNSCKAGQFESQYLIVCKTDNSGWIIKSY